MTDDPKKVGHPDREEISLKQRHEVRYWMSRFNCTEDELVAAVKAAGHRARDVEVELGRRNQGLLNPNNPYVAPRRKK